MWIYYFIYLILSFEGDWLREINQKRNYSCSHKDRTYFEFWNPPEGIINCIAVIFIMGFFLDWEIISLDLILWIFQKLHYEATSFSPFQSNLMDNLVSLLIQELLLLIDAWLNLVEFYDYLGLNSKYSLHLFQGYFLKILISQISTSSEHQITPHLIQKKQHKYRMKKIKGAYHRRHIYYLNCLISLLDYYCCSLYYC